MLFCLMNYEESMWLVNFSFARFLPLTFAAVFKLQEKERLDLTSVNKD